MTDLLTHAQLRMLAQTLRTDPQILEGLSRLGADNLRQLREHISGLLFDADEPVFARLSKLSPLIPNALLTKIVAAAVPPEVGGRAGGSLGLAHPDRVTDVLGSLPAAYLADAAPHLDPRTIAALAPRLSGGMLIPTALELLRRADYTTASRFIEHATDELLDDLERGIPDDAGLLRTVALIPDTDRLDTVIARLPSERQVAVVRAAATGDDETLLAGLSVLARLAPDARGELTTALIDMSDDENLARVLAVTSEHGALSELLNAVSATEVQIRQRVAEAIAAAAGSAAAEDLRDRLAELGAPLP